MALHPTHHCPETAAASRPRAHRASTYVGAGALALALGLLASIASRATAAAPAQPSAWPSNWTLLESDPNENGCDPHRNVINAYTANDANFLYFRLENVDPAGWPSTSPSGDARYKWWIDTNGGDMVLSGGNIDNAEFVLMVEDLTLNSADPTLTRDRLGEATFMDDLANTGFTTRWGGSSPPDYTVNTPANAPSPSTLWRRVLGTGTAGAGGPQGSMTDPVIGYRVNGTFVDMYVSRARLGNPTSVCGVWATDNQDNNLDQAPNCDRTEATCLSIIGPTPTPTPVPTATATPSPTGARLMTLDAGRRGGVVTVTWRTAAETDLLGFQVYRVRPGHEPVRVNRSLLPARGSAAAGGSYQVTDRTAPGAVDYRLVAVNSDGTQETLGQARLRR